MAGNVDEVSAVLRQVLWVASGRPPIRWFDCGHYSAVNCCCPHSARPVDFFAAEVPR